MRKCVHSAGIRVGRENNQRGSSISKQPGSISSKPNTWLTNSNPFFYSQLPSFMLWGQITVFYYFASLLCILFISVVLPSLGHFFQKPNPFLPAICILGKTTNRYNVLLPNFKKISPLYSCHAASFINLELNAETPLFWFFLFSQCICHFPESEILLLDN